MKILKMLIGVGKPKRNSYEEVVISRIDNDIKKDEKTQEYYNELVEENNKLLNRVLQELED